MRNIHFYKTDVGVYVLSDLNGDKVNITRSALDRAAISGNGFLFLSVAPIARERFGYLEKESPIIVWNILNADDEPYDVATLQALVDDFFINGRAGGGEGATLDFLFVDTWTGDEGNYYNAIVGRLRVCTDEGDVYIAKQITVDTEIFIAGAGSDPYVPISQTTIFIHPTTFQRYLFNGTEMVEYDDVNNVVPKWLKYEALLSQTGTDAPVARVLNQDERDYLGDIVWDRENTGVYKFTNSKLSVNERTINGIGNVVDEADTGLPVTAVVRSVVNFDVILYKPDGSTVDDALSYTPFELKQRVRGNPPKLMAAETNTTGDKVILTFDKEMSGYGLDVYPFSIGKSVETCTLVSSKVIELLISEGEYVLNGEDVTVEINEYSPVESRDYGLLQPFENFPVVNNVIAEEV